MSEIRKLYPFYVLSSIRLLHRPEGTMLRDRRLPAPMLLYATKGGGRIRIGRHTWNIEADHLVFIPAGIAFHAEIGSEGIEYYQLIFRAARVAFDSNGSVAEPIASVPGLPEHTITSVPGGEAWRNRLSGLLAVEAVSNSLQCKRDGELLQLLSDLILAVEHVNDRPVRSDGIRQSMDYIENNYSLPITRDVLARIAMLTPGAYCRSFKRSTGLTPTEYLQRVRIEKAKQRLADGASLKEAAVAVGYSNEFHFSRIFKKVSGMPPTTYIRREVLRIAIATRFHWKDNLQAIGCKPVLAVDCYRHPGMDEFEYERRVILRLGELRETRPDLIIADFSHEPFYDTFKKIAPTIIIEHSFDWRHTHLQLAELVGRRGEAEETIALSERLAAETGRRLRAVAAGQHVAMMQIMLDHVILQGTIRHPLNDLLYRELGLQADPAVPRDSSRLQATAQDIPELAAHHLWIRKYSEHADVQAILRHLQARGFWSAMPAFHAGNIRFVGNWLLMSWTPQGRREIMAEVEACLTGKSSV